MKTLYTYLGILALAVMFTSCEKEVFAPNTEDTTEVPTENTKGITPISNDCGPRPTAVDPTGEVITDPNDDDFMKKPVKTKK